MENEDKCGGESCKCNCDEVVLRAKLRQIVLVREEAEESAETRRRAFVQERWPFRSLWMLLQILPLFVLLSIEKVEPLFSRIYHDQLVYAAVALTCLFILIVHIKRARIEREFAKLHPEDAETLAWSYVDEDD
jgi:hypothetical protein